MEYERSGTLRVDAESSSFTADGSSGLRICRLIPLRSSDPHYSITNSADDVLKIGRSQTIPEVSRWTDPRISGLHCSICYRNGVVTIVDSSTNGIYVNAKRIVKGSSVELKHGDTLTLALRMAKDGNPPQESIDYLIQQQLDDSTTTTLLMMASPPSVSESEIGGNAPLAVTSGELPKEDDQSSTDKMEATLTCGICQTLFHKPMTLIPCMHNFCASCYSQWISNGSGCPQCRSKVESVRKNHVIVNLVDDFLSAHPTKRRTDDELKELDKRDVISNAHDGALKAVLKRKHSSSSSGSDEPSVTDDSSDTGGSDTSSESSHRVAAARSPVIPADTCRACRSPDTHNFQCGPVKSHQRCIQCRSLFPLRWDCSIPTLCAICMQPFCDLYWGCTSSVGQGSLNILKSHPMDMIPTHTFGGNRTEIDILTAFVRIKGLTCGEVWAHCLRTLEEHPSLTIQRMRTANPKGFALCSTVVPAAGTIAFSVPSPTTVISPASVSSSSPMPSRDCDVSSLSSVSADVVSSTSVTTTTLSAVQSHDDLVRPDTVCCRRCATDIFAALLYGYRVSIPHNELPLTVTSRKDCYYGVNCRTQFGGNNSSQHAQRLNHICEQTRFT
jgi:E3 ubiquitin-protein ligase CHFR